MALRAGAKECPVFYVISRMARCDLIACCLIGVVIAIILAAVLILVAAVIMAMTGWY